MRSLLLLFPLALLTACGGITFEVARDIPEQRVEGNVVSMLLGGWLESPIPMNINLEQETAARDTGPACAARLRSLTFTVTDTGRGPGDADDFDFVDAVTIHVASAHPDSALPRAVMARIDPAPRDAASLALSPADLDLLPYVEEGAVVTAEASGSPPPDDVTFVGRYVIEIETL